MTYPVQLDGVDPLVSVLGVLCSQVPHAVVYAYVQTALVEFMRLNNGHTGKGHRKSKVSKCVSDRSRGSHTAGLCTTPEVERDAL